MIQCCAVEGCTNDSAKLIAWADEHCTIHNDVHQRCGCRVPFGLFQFPRDEVEMKKWIDSINRSDDNWLPSVVDCVCSNHFEDGQPTHQNPYPTLNLCLRKKANSRKTKNPTRITKPQWGENVSMGTTSENNTSTESTNHHEDEKDFVTPDSPPTIDADNSPDFVVLNFPEDNQPSQLDQNLQSLRSSVAVGNFALTPTHHGKLKRKSYTFAEKIGFIDEIHQGTTQSEVSQKYGIAESTVRGWMKEETKLRRLATEIIDGGSRRKKAKMSMNDPLDRAVLTWFTQQCAQGLPVTGPNLQSQAVRFSRILDENSTFAGSSGWLQRFKNRHGIRMKAKTSMDGIINEALMFTTNESIMTETEIVESVKTTCEQRAKIIEDEKIAKMNFQWKKRKSSKNDQNIAEDEANRGTDTENSTTSGNSAVIKTTDTTNLAEVIDMVCSNDRGGLKLQSDLSENCDDSVDIDKRINEILKTCSFSPPPKDSENQILALAAQNSGASSSGGTSTYSSIQTIVDSIKISLMWAESHEKSTPAMIFHLRKLLQLAKSESHKLKL